MSSTNCSNTANWFSLLDEDGTARVVNISTSSKQSLTPQQRALWLLSQGTPDDVRYNVGFACRVIGNLNVDALRLSLSRLAAHTPVLRSIFPNIQGRPGLAVDDRLRPELVRIDVDGLDDLELSRTVQNWHYRPFDLATESSLRLGLFERGRGEAVLSVCAHHIIADFTSLGLILDQIEAFYLDEIGTEPAKWLERSRYFAEYAEVEEVLRAGPGGESTEAYWLERLKQPPSMLAWSDNWRLGRRAEASCFFKVGASQYRAIRDLAQQAGSSTFPIMLAAWAAVIARNTRSHDVIIGVPISIREFDFRNTIGNLLDVLPVRLQVQGTFKDVVTEAKSAVFSALEHRRFDLADMVTRLKVPRQPDRNPLFQTLVNMLGRTGQSRWLDLMLAPDYTRSRWADLTVSPWRIDQQEGQVDIALDFVDAQEELRCVVKGDTRLFSSRGLQRFVDEFLCELDLSIANPQRNVSLEACGVGSDYNVVPGALNKPVHKDDSIASLVDWIDRRTAIDPSLTAVRERGRALSYGELKARSELLAGHLLHDLGAKQGRIGVALTAGIDAVVAMLSIMRAGSGYVPMDPTLPDERVHAIIGRSDIEAVIGDTSTLRQRSWPVPTVDLSQLGDEPVRSSPTGLDRSKAEGLAYSVFTSGSIGGPKGIDVEHRNVVAFLQSMFREVSTAPGQIWSWYHAASFDLSVWEIWGALCSGGSVLVVPEEVRGQADQVISLLDREGVNIITQTPSALKNLLPVFSRAQHLQAACHWIICGEALPGETARHFLSHRWTLWNLYGPAETTVYTSIEKVTDELTHYPVVPLGRPLSFATVYVRDGDVTPPIGQQGELQIGGAGVARGYVGSLTADAARFIDDPYIPGGRTYRTGDLGYWDGERLHFSGRLDDQIKVNGYRVELGEVESGLESHEQVRQAAVFLETLSGLDRLVAVIQPVSADAGVNEQSLRNHLRLRLPAYMQPTRFLATRTMPINRHGKLDRNAVKGLWAEEHARHAIRPMPSGLGTEDSSLSDFLVSVWCEVLGRDDVGPTDRFFEIGGNSMAIAQVYARLRARGDCRLLAVSDLFRFPTIQSLCEFLDDSGRPSPDPQSGVTPMSRRQQTLRDRGQRRNLPDND